MPCLFKAIGQDRGFPSGYAERISKLIPAPIQHLPCFLDRLTGIWRYEYGAPITLPMGGGVIVGTPMFPEVERLFDVVGCAAWRLDKEKLGAYLVRLADSNHHEDVLVELAPILRLGEVTVEHEFRGKEKGASTVDWRISAPGHPVLLLEVKNRIRDLIESFEAIKHLDPHETIPAPSHDHAMLFKSVLHKFKIRRPDETIQGCGSKRG